MSSKELQKRIIEQQAIVGIVGMGYVGLPLALAFAGKGFKVVGFDVDPEKVRRLAAGESYIKHIDAQAIRAALERGFQATTDIARSRDCDAVLICVPTPLTAQREPDLKYVVGSCEAVAPHLRPGQLHVLESTTYPGTTDEVMRPILERGGLKAGRDIFLAFSPEREDPGNPDFTTVKIPKVVGADDPESLDAARALYGAIMERVVPVSSTRAAEATKILENTYRAVNIALVNELKIIFTRMGIDVWEVIDAAGTKPFGYQKFYPGPGLGGHCIPIDPFYLTWKAREFEIATRFIETAGEVNRGMPQYVVDRTMEAFSDRGRGLKGARVLVVGISYKKNVDDARESPSYRLMDLFEARGAQVSYFDPYFSEIPASREYGHFQGRRGVPLSEAGRFDVVVVATDHDSIDWTRLLADSKLIVDTRGVYRTANEKVIKA